MVPLDKIKGDFTYSVHSGIVENEFDSEKQNYEPDTRGKKMHPENCEVNVKKINHTTADKKQYMISITSADIDNKYTHRYLSLICKEKGVISQKVTAYMN